MLAGVGANRAHASRQDRSTNVSATASTSSSESPSTPWLMSPPASARAITTRAARRARRAAARRPRERASLGLSQRVTQSIPERQAAGGQRTDGLMKLVLRLRGSRRHGSPAYGGRPRKTRLSRTPLRRCATDRHSGVRGSLGPGSALCAVNPTQWAGHGDFGTAHRRQAQRPQGGDELPSPSTACPAAARLDAGVGARAWCDQRGVARRFDVRWRRPPAPTRQQTGGVRRRLAPPRPRSGQRAAPTDPLSHRRYRPSSARGPPAVALPRCPLATIRCRWGAWRRDTRGAPRRHARSLLTITPRF